MSPSPAHPAPPGPRSPEAAERDPSRPANSPRPADPSRPVHATDRKPGDRSAPIRVALLDDHHLVREGLRLVLESDTSMEIVGDAANGGDAFQLVEESRPDVLVMDVTLPDGDGILLVRALRARHPELRVVMLTMHRDAETVRQALQAGAGAYVVKGARSADLCDAIRAVMRGERYLHSSVTGAIVDDSIRWQQSGGPISAREREVLALLGTGQTATRIGLRLGISPHTVRRHIANLTTKLGVKGQVGLVRYAVEHGLTRDETEPGTDRRS